MSRLGSFINCETFISDEKVYGRYMTRHPQDNNTTCRLPPLIHHLEEAEQPLGDAGPRQGRNRIVRTQYPFQEARHPPRSSPHDQPGLAAFHHPCAQKNEILLQKRSYFCDRKTETFSLATGIDDTSSEPGNRSSNQDLPSHPVAANFRHAASKR